MDFINWIIANWVGIMASVGAVVTAASVIAKLTPSTHDDEVIQAIINFINALAINKAPETK